MGVKTVESAYSCKGKQEYFSQCAIIGPKGELANAKFREEHDDASHSGSSLVSDPEDQVTRDQWNSKTEFLFSCISYSIGLGNLWRFPFKCYENGGGAFLIPYLVFLFIAGMPLYFLELSMGQFSSQGPFGVWHISRLFIGLGYAMVTISFFCSVYYNVIVAWILHYLWASLKSLVLSEPLPWTDKACLEGSLNKTQEARCANLSTIYWEREVLMKTDSLEDLGGFQYELLIAFCFAWVFVGIFLIRGVKSSGKITYFTALFPYLIIAALLVRGLTLPGASEGLKFYLVPDWNKLMDPNVWNTAASQIFYSLGLAFGSLITLASYSPFKNNVLRMTLIVTTVNCSTSIIAGVVIFSVIGHLAHELNVDVGKVMDSGPGLAFVVYPDAVSRMPGAAIWASLFFFMLLNLGFGSQLALVETVITAVVDRVPSLLRHKWIICIIVCVVMFVLGLPMVTKAGIHWLNLMDTYSCSHSLFIISFVEVTALIYIYGARRLLDQIEAMLDKRTPGYWWWFFAWAVTAPFSILLIFCLNLYMYSPMVIEGAPIPCWAEVVGWVMAMTSVAFIPVLAVYEFCQVSGSPLERLSQLLKPDQLYRPASITDLKEVNELFKRDNLPLIGMPPSPDMNRSNGVQMGKAAGDSLDTFA